MNSLPFRSLIRGEKTLIIACHDQHTGEESDWHEDVIILRSPGNVIHRYHYRQQEILRQYLEEGRCKQILVVGHIHQDAVDQIMRDKSSGAVRTALDFNLKPFLRHPQPQLITDSERDHLLIELNVIQQCNLLMEYDFIRSLVAKHQLNIIGVVGGTPDHRAVQVFYNGIAYNYLISLN